MTFDIAEVEAIDQGIYNAIVKKIETKTIESGQYAGNTIRIWTFEVDVNGTKQTVSSSSSMNTGPRSKAHQWLSAIFRRGLVPGEKGLSPVGYPCRVHLIVDDESGYNKVAAVLPAEGPRKAAAPVSAPPSADFDDDLPPLEEPPMVEEGDIPF